MEFDFQGEMSDNVRMGYLNYIKSFADLSVEIRPPMHLIYWGVVHAIWNIDPTFVNFRNGKDILRYALNIGVLSEQDLAEIRKLL
jgi:hypothetical protein